MTTRIEERELDTELQELYLVSKQWTADLEFLESELDFLKKLTGQQRPDAVRVEEFAQIADLAQTYAALTNSMTDYRRRLEPLITHIGGDFGLDLVEEYSQLQRRLKTILRDCHNIRNTVFDRSKQGLPNSVACNK
jgi:DNA repair exonuclease SbcCD ATPase subunit